MAGPYLVENPHLIVATAGPDDAPSTTEVLDHALVVRRSSAQGRILVPFPIV
jgi:hypothetical protein